MHPYFISSELFLIETISNLDGKIVVNQAKNLQASWHSFFLFDYINFIRNKAKNTHLYQNVRNDYTRTLCADESEFES